MFYQIIALQSGSRTKTIINKEYSEVLQNYVIPFVKNGVLEEIWGKKKVAYQVLELRIYKTETKWDKKEGKKLEAFIKGKSNCFKSFEKKAKELINTRIIKVFIVTPIQGKEKGNQEEQRIYTEYNNRFLEIEQCLKKHGCTAIRIDKEFTIKNLAERIRKEIHDSSFVIADLTDERPSCYYEVGYAEALSKPVIYFASDYSVIDTKMKTKIHFDIHNNINYFSNHGELVSKLNSSIEKNKKELFKQ